MSSAELVFLNRKNTMNIHSMAVIENGAQLADDRGIGVAGEE
jgi:hypothetical protein